MKVSFDPRCNNIAQKCDKRSRKKGLGSGVANIFSLALIKSNLRFIESELNLC